MPLGLLEDVLVVVHVHHRDQPTLEGLMDRPVHAVEELGVDPVGGRVRRHGLTSERGCEPSRSRPP